MALTNRQSKQIKKCRNDFPALRRKHNGYPLAYFDGPGGTQVPTAVIDAIADYYYYKNANTHGFFITSEETDGVLNTARQKMALFLGAQSPDQISFGANMTTLAFSLSTAFKRFLKKGDEILITQLDHEANRGPWIKLKKSGLTVREVRLKADGALDYDDFSSKINASTRLVAMGMASNALGTVNDIHLIRKLTKNVGAWLLVDAVHFAPHFSIDVNNFDIDFLFCSAYKFYGPHVGILYSKTGLLDELDPDRLRTQDQQAPYRIETGTLNHAAIAGVSAAVDYIAALGDAPDPRNCLVEAMNTIQTYEHSLAVQLYEQIKMINGITLYGPSMDTPMRTPTVSFTVEEKHPEEVCRLLANKGICAWDGHFYAIRPVEILGLARKGGLTRTGISLYNSEDEVNRLISELKKIAESA